MSTRDLAAVVLSACPFPTISPDGTLRDGISFPACSTCVACQDRQCARLHDHSGDSLIGSTCYRKMAIVRLLVGTLPIVICGLLFSEQAARLSRRDKKRLDQWRLKEDVVRGWADQAAQHLAVLDTQVQAQISQSLAMLHDVQTSVSLIFRSAEELVHSQPGADFEEQLDKLPEPAINLVKAVQVLQGRIKLLPLLANPGAARYGQRHPTPIYRVIDRLVRIFKPLAQRERHTLRLTGSSFNTPMVFESFEAVPLILLDNALKYSHSNQEVSIVVNDIMGGVRVEISSFSLFIPPEERQRIFQQGFRSRHAEIVASRGTGLGLHIANLVAQANNFEVRVSAHERPVLIDGIPYCNNTFHFTVR